MQWFLKLGFFSMADKVTDAIGKSLPYILTGAVIAAIWIYFLLLTPHKPKGHSGFLSYLRDVLTFRIMLSSVIAKIFYIACALVVLVIGIIAMFAANILVGFIGMLVLEIVLRVLFEIFMVLFSIQENVVAIRDQTHTLHEEACCYDEDLEEDED
ncbi:MAG: DUF4282 domain-containing protein [Clostridia bacterium]|nr:DUF4282 domain-containing protein [Clostridia bacterium]